MLTEALLAAITEAVFGYLLEQTGLTSKMRAWLQGDPQHLAFQVALAQAFTKFAQSYPSWTSSFFDEHFLKGRAAPLLARFLTPDGPPSSTELASAWADELKLKRETREQHIAELTPAASAFVGWLRAALRDRNEFRPFFDSYALDAVSENTAQTNQELRELREDLSRAMAEVFKYQVTIKNGANFERPTEEPFILDIGTIHPPSESIGNAEVRFSLTNSSGKIVKVTSIFLEVVKYEVSRDFFTATVAAPIDEYFLHVYVKPSVSQYELLTTHYELRQETEGFFLKIDAAEGYVYTFRLNAIWHILGKEKNTTSSPLFEVKFPVKSAEGLFKLAEFLSQPSDSKGGN